MGGNLREKLMSRKFWIAVATAVFIVLSEGLDLNVDKDIYWKLVILAISYIFGESAVDIARVKALPKWELPINIKKLQQEIKVIKKFLKIKETDIKTQSE
ncbi:hypothetical protein SAMN05660826_01545 [Caldanaerovirga acetigignens]|uniref:Uncharacterized protein n=1 Tax=Caldanaerovirga acetigignens TaxID=447595 RepID=A0A1M7KEV2_9FIRM|nr:hypothetical protein [Caldanaerovirga acetigignens]SHM63800.1 hypothetical protein SAMN05660826_01545 [Caldanaerovirga acetigignens]